MEKDLDVKCILFHFLSCGTDFEFGTEGMNGMNL